jgi:hypothetical protein
MFKIRDLTFHVDPAETTVRAYLDPTSPILRWCINVECKPTYIDGLYWEPRLYHESLWFNVSDWHSLASIRHVFPAKPPIDSCLYNFEHGEIGDSMIALSNRRGPVFNLEWKCVGNAYAGEGYSTDVPIYVKTEVQFRQITVSLPAVKTPEEAREQLANHFDITTLQPPEQVRSNCDGMWDRFLFRPSDVT